MSGSCDCCNPAGGAPGIPPGQSSFAYRVGTYGSFYAAMLQRLSSSQYPALAGLKTRDPDDAAIALCDAWAVVADVLTFYQERIANEGYLSTATERRSVIEMGRLANYPLRPGVAANVYLAYTMASGSQATIDAGQRAQSVPPPGSLPQTFETAEALDASDTWNNLAPRMTWPQLVDSTSTALQLQGVSNNLKKNDALLLVESNTASTFWRVSDVTVQAPAKQTLVSVYPPDDTPTTSAAERQSSPTVAAAGAPDPQGGSAGAPTPFRSIFTLVTPLSTRPASNPWDAQRLKRTMSVAFDPSSDMPAALLGALSPSIAQGLRPALAKTEIGAEPTAEVYALRVQAAPFGHNAPLDYTPNSNGTVTIAEWPLTDPNGTALPDGCTIQLDAVYDQIVPNSWIVIERPSSSSKYRQVLAQVKRTQKTSVARYNLAGRVTELTLDTQWLDTTVDTKLSDIRDTVVSAASEKLPLAEESITEAISGGEIELGDLYGGLQSGRWLIVQGTRTDVAGGLSAAELVMLASVKQGVALAANGVDPRAGEKTHSFLELQSALAYTYQRDTVKIYGNVTRATQGESRAETLGSGDATIAGQRFVLHMAPVTFVSAPTAPGSQTSLTVTVNDVAWTEVKSLAGSGPTDRVYVTSTDDAGVTTVIFGDGVHGSRLPTGVANVKAQYRSGIGTAGNVGAGEISLLVSRPAGVQAVVNPLPATGGADSESRDQARQNLPVGTMALDRLVSPADYAVTARTFAGVAKASVVQLRDASGNAFIGVTVAGPGNGDIPAQSDLIPNLTAALQQAGGGGKSVEVAPCEIVLLIAGVTLTPAAGVSWEVLSGQVRTALLVAFGFDQRGLGQSVALSEFLAAIHKVPGVTGATVTQFDSITRADAATAGGLQKKLSAIAAATVPEQTISASPGSVDSTGAFVGAQLVIFNPDITDTLILNQGQ